MLFDAFNKGYDAMDEFILSQVTAWWWVVVGGGPA